MNPQSHPSVPPTGKAPRLHYIDWLRVLAVLLLFPFHVSRVFNYEDFYVKDGVLSEGLGYVLGFIDVWHMPLLFFLAGASTYFALGKRGAGGYLLERVKRLLVPFLFGFLVLIPPQTWLGGRFNSGYTGSFWHYLTSGDWLVMNIRDGGDYYGGFGIGHLWFIMFLFMISVVALPLLLGGRTRRGARGAARISRLLSRPWGWPVAAFVILLAEAMPETGGINFFYYMSIFLLGWFAFADPQFALDAARYRRPALLLGLALTLFSMGSASFRHSLADPSLARTGLTLLVFLGGYLIIVGILGHGRMYLDRTSPALRYLAEASYPVYLLHQTVIVVIAFYLVALPGPWPLRWVLLLTGSVAATFALYEGVRRVSVLRALFGMRRARRAPTAVGDRPVAAPPLPERSGTGVVAS